MTIEENIQMEGFQQDGNDSVCRENVVLGPEKTYINVSFYHPLFDVNSHLLPGISYYGEYVLLFSPLHTAYLCGIHSKFPVRSSPQFVRDDAEFTSQVSGFH